MRDYQFIAGLYPVKKRRSATVKNRKKPARKGSLIKRGGKNYKIVERDLRFKSAYFIEDMNGERMPFSISRDMFEVV